MKARYFINKIDAEKLTILRSALINVTTHIFWMVRYIHINVFSFVFSKNSIFHVIRKSFWDKTSTYIGKLKKISITVRIKGPVRIALP